ncbi:hypothetical protein NDU88_005440 [Pleurodeles waltl]|uniref:Uncharacterized protein n=1 Tax=Pleurodeles waltl TaxID=8319 RepID=A0AAV7VJ22_PLEWA|nr:hypothetical protein NDU88_005440 [Pleurodeles waltl]
MDRGRHNCAPGGWKRGSRANVSMPRRKKRKRKQPGRRSAYEEGSRDTRGDHRRPEKQEVKGTAYEIEGT